MDDTGNPSFQAMYDELVRLAGHLDPRHAVADPTSLVHEAWLKVGAVDEVADRLHFKRLAARAMRQVLVDRLRHHGREKRGGAWERVTLADVAGAPQVDVAALNDALTTLAEADPEAAELVELRFFGGLSQAEAAEALGWSLRSAERRWRTARAFLNHVLSP